MKKILTILSIAITLPTMSQSFEEGEKLFKQNCASCHKMDKKVVGPALQNVVEEQGADWVTHGLKTTKLSGNQVIHMQMKFTKSITNQSCRLTNTWVMKD